MRCSRCFCASWSQALSRIQFLRVSIHLFEEYPNSQILVNKYCTKSTVRSRVISKFMRNVDCSRALRFRYLSSLQKHRQWIQQWSVGLLVRGGFLRRNAKPQVSTCTSSSKTPVQILWRSGFRQSRLLQCWVVFNYYWGPGSDLRVTSVPISNSKR